MAPFSPSDVIEEYTRPARIITNTMIESVDALTDLHEINVTGFGTMEAFLTDGLRSLLNSAMSPNMREYKLGGQDIFKSGRLRKMFYRMKN